MASIVVAGDTSGAITIAAPAVAGTNTLTLPTNTGTIITTASTFAGTGPAFSAQSSATASFTAATFTKIQLQTENFDTASCFNNTGSTVGSIPSYAFLPNVAGYYQLNGYLSFNSSSVFMQLVFYKNGSSIGNNLQINTASGGYINALVYMNGSTDYLEIYGYTANTQNCSGAFSGFLARAA